MGNHKEISIITVSWSTSQNLEKGYTNFQVASSKTMFHIVSQIPKLNPKINYCVIENHSLARMKF
jgi:hypothetical protein